MKLAFVDYRISVEEHKNLSKYVDKIILVPKNTNLYPAINGHPDIQLTLINEQDISLIVSKDVDKSFIDVINNLDVSFEYSTNSLKSNYPFDIPLNCLFMKNFFIHTLDNSDKKLLDLSKNKININVNQGYTKCSTVIVNERALITSDKGIYNKLSSYDFDILLINPGNIELPGLDYGFIGGCTGLIEENKLAFYGNLDFHPQGNEIKKFLAKHHVEPVYLYNGPLIDRGSIFTLY